MTSEDATATAGLPPHATSEGPLGATIALSVVLALGTLFLVAPLLWRILPVTPLPPPFPSHHQDAETLIFLLAFGVLTPLGIVAGRRIATAVATGPNGASVSVLAASLSGGLALVVILTRVSARASWGGGPAVLAAGAAGLVAPGGRGPRPRSCTGLAPAGAGRRPHPAHLGGGRAAARPAGAVVHRAPRAVGARSPDRRGRRDPQPARRHRRVERRRLMGWRGRAVDLGIVALLVLAIPNVFVVAAGDPSTALETSIVQFHQNFYLGPANQVLAGDSMLVEVISQYGVGSIYFLAAAFHVVPIGNGTLGLVEGGLSVLMFVGTFLVLRMAGASRLVASTTMGVAVVALVYGLLNPLGALLQHGAFRFGMPVGVLLRRGRRGPVAPGGAACPGVPAPRRRPRGDVGPRGVRVLAGDGGRRGRGRRRDPRARSPPGARPFTRRAGSRARRRPPPLRRVHRRALGRAAGLGLVPQHPAGVPAGRHRELDLRLLVVLAGAGGGGALSGERGGDRARAAATPRPARPPPDRCSSRSAG